MLRNSLRAVARMSQRSSSTITPVKTAAAPPPAASYSQAVKVNGFIYVSGQIPYTSENKPLADSSVEAAAEQVIQNVKNILEASGSSLDSIVKNTIFLTDMDNQFPLFNKVYGKYFNANTHLPARSCVAVKQLPLGVLLEMESIAIEKSDAKL